MGRFCVWLLSFVSVMLVASSAFAQAPGDGAQLKLGPMFGFGGDIEGEAEYDTNFGGFTLEEEIDENMEATYGLMGNYDVPIHDHISLGARLMLATFNDQERADEDWARNWLLNLNFAPRLHVEARDVPIEFYATTPLGPSFQFPGEDWEDEGSIELGTGVDWNVSLLIGANYWLDDTIGGFIEAGWMVQNIDWDGETTGDNPSDVEIDASFGQFALNLGITLPM